METNSLQDVFSAGAIDRARKADVQVYWNDNRLAKITRLRLLSDPGLPWWDVSYCWGELKDGTECRVDLPFSELPKRNMMGKIIDYAKKDKVYLKPLGLFGNISTLS